MTLYLPRFGLLLLALFCSACAQDPGTVTVSALTLNDAPPGVRMRAGYLSIENTTATPRKLVSASSTAYALVEFHRTVEIDGQSRMREEKDVTIAPGQTVIFEPFGLHIMLMRPAEPLVADRDVVIELCFANGDCATASAAP
ncbi:MAG: copper chaperone PCu(A)C [Gammaproteobacteria bacterium]